MMSFEEFTNRVKTELLSYLDSKNDVAGVEIKTTIKNNGQEVTGVTVKRSNSDVGSFVHLNPAYTYYQETGDFEEIMLGIASAFNRGVSQTDKDAADKVRYFSRISDLILPVFVNTAKNKETLKNRPHRNVEDLSIIYKIVLSDEIAGRKSISVTNDIIKIWSLYEVNPKITEELLYKTAIKNLSKEKYMLKPIEDIIAEVLGLPSPGISSGMYVLTGKSRIDGFSMILNEEAMQDAISTIDGDFYIIPSSVHEALLLDCSCHKSPSDIAEFTDMVNGLLPDQGDVLSDSLYAYSPKNGLKKIA